MNSSIKSLKPSAGQNKIPAYFPYLMITVLAALLYLKTLFFGLTFLDDDIWLSSPKLKLQNLTGILNAFLTTDISGIYYRPMITLSFLLDSIVSGFIPYSFRITNIGLHVINSCLVYALFKRLHYKPHIALSFSLIFTVHPLLVQAVAWLPGRTDSLLCVFILSAILRFISFLDTNNNKDLFGHFLFFFLALLTKEIALVLPLVCWAYFLLLRVEKKDASTALKTILPGCVAVFAWFLLRQLASGGAGALPADTIKTFLANLPGVFLYFGKMFLPVNLSVLPILADSNLWIGAFTGLCIAGLLAISKTRRNRFVLFGLLWFLIFLLPPFVYGYVLPEYRGYIPVIGVFILFHETSITAFMEKNSFRNLIVTGMVVVVFFSIASATADFYTNRILFWENAALNSPHSPTAHVNLAYAYYDSAEQEKAKMEFEKTLILNPQAPTVHYNLAVIHYYQGHPGLALEHLKKELNHNPFYPQAISLLKLLESKK